MSHSPIKAAYSVQSVKPMNSLASSFRFVLLIRQEGLENVFLQILQSSLENTNA